MRLIRLISFGLPLLATVTAVSCGGGAGDSSGTGDDDDDGTTPTPTVVGISGLTIDYFTELPVPSALFGTEGLDPELGGASDGAGAFVLIVPSVATFRLRVSGVSGYRATSGHLITTDGIDQPGHIAPLVATADLQRQYASVGATATADRGAVFLELWTPAGAPLENVPASDMMLLDSADSPVTSALGPYFFGTGGDLVDNATLAASTAFDGRARAGFLDVPQGDLHVAVTWSSGGTIVTETVPVTIPSDGVALRRMY